MHGDPVTPMTGLEVLLWRPDKRLETTKWLRQFKWTDAWTAARELHGELRERMCTPWPRLLVRRGV